MRHRLASVASQVSHAIDRRPSDPVLDGLRSVLAADYGLEAGGASSSLDDAEAAEEVEERLRRLARVARLEPLDVALLVLATAPELDGMLGRAFAALQGDPRWTRPRVALALELTGHGTLDAGARARLGAAGPLLQAGLLAVDGDAPFLERALQVPDRVVDHLLGGVLVDERLRHVVVDAVPLPLPATAVIGRAFAGGAGLVWVREPPGGAGLTTATGAFAAMGIGAVAVDLDVVPKGTPLAPLLRLATLEATLSGGGLAVVGADRLVEEEPGVLRDLEVAAVPVAAVGRRAWEPTWTAVLPVTVEAPVLEAEVRSDLWLVLLGDGGVYVPPLPDGTTPSVKDSDPARWRDLVSLRVTPEEIVRIARAAAEDAEARDAMVELSTVRTAARRLGGGGGRGVSSSGPRAGFADLVLPPETLTHLTEMVSWARHRDEVLGQGPVAGAGGKGRGIAALFSGSPGTGKTLGASVIAAELGLDLQTVELSSVVDKYIGETEKNLEKVFREAEALNVVLFFDEADALFGSRSEVKDSRDRYANQEVAYLLQRMEAFNGIAILASNLRGNLDAAFSRRLHFIVHFPDPDAPTRRRLWERHLAALAGTDPTDPVDVDLLAERVELSGGDVRNIVLAAAYAAAGEGGLVGMRLVAASAEREYRKLGRRVPERGFRS